MKKIRWAAVVAGLAWTASVLQAQSPALNISVVHETNRTVVTIQNLGRSALKACLIWVRSPPPTDATQIIYRDAAIETSIEPILPMQQQPMEPHGGGLPAGWQGTIEVKAALWSDGSTYSDADWLQRLLDRRVAYLKHLNIASTILDEAIRSETGPQTLIAQLQVPLDAITTATENREDFGVLREPFYNFIINTIRRPPVRPNRPFSYHEVLDYCRQRIEERREKLVKNT